MLRSTLVHGDYNELLTHILVIDDDASIRSFVSDLLQYEGYDVSVAADGLKACCSSKPMHRMQSYST